MIRESGVREGRGKTEARPCRVMVRQGKLEVRKLADLFLNDSSGCCVQNGL